MAGQDAAVIVCHHQHWGKKIKTKGPSGVGPTPRLVAMTDNTTKAKGAVRLCPPLRSVTLFHVKGCLPSSGLSGC